MIRTLIFDLGDVLVGLDFDRAYRAAAKLNGRPAEEIPEMIRRADLTAPYERGEVSSEQFHRRFTAELELDVSYEDFGRLWGDMFQPEPLIGDAVLEALARERRLLLLSNTNELHFEWLQARYPLLGRFDDFVLSHRVGVMKPGAEIYEEALRRADCAPNECFFTDDQPGNVAGARRAGIDAEVFRGPEALFDQLRARGVSW